jgi:aconitate hydratase
VVITKSFARIHWQNLINFGILPLVFANPADYTKLNVGDVLVMTDVPNTLRKSHEILATVAGKNIKILLQHKMSPRQIDVLIDGGLINWVKKSVHEKTKPS